MFLRYSNSGQFFMRYLDNTKLAEGASPSTRGRRSYQLPSDQRRKSPSFSKQHKQWQKIMNYGAGATPAADTTLKSAHLALHTWGWSESRIKQKAPYPQNAAARRAKGTKKSRGVSEGYIYISCTICPAGSRELHCLFRCRATSTGAPRRASASSTTSPTLETSVSRPPSDVATPRPSGPC